MLYLNYYDVLEHAWTENFTNFFIGDNNACFPVAMASYCYDGFWDESYKCAEAHSQRF